MVRGKFLVSIVDNKFPFEKEKMAQLKLVVLCAYCANSEFNRIRAFELVSNSPPLPSVGFSMVFHPEAGWVGLPTSIQKTKIYN